MTNSIFATALMEHYHYESAKGELRQRRQGEAEESLSLAEIEARMKELEGASSGGN